MVTKLFNCGCASLSESQDESSSPKCHRYKQHLWLTSEQYTTSRLWRSISVKTHRAGSMNTLSTLESSVIFLKAWHQTLSSHVKSFLLYRGVYSTDKVNTSHSWFKWESTSSDKQQHESVPDNWIMWEGVRLWLMYSFLQCYLCLSVLLFWFFLIHLSYDIINCDYGAFHNCNQSCSPSMLIVLIISL